MSDDPDTNDEAEPPSEAQISGPMQDRGAAIAEAIAGSIIMACRIFWFIVGRTTRTLATATMRFLPFVGTLWWRGWWQFAFKQYHKKAGGDVIGLVVAEDTEKVELKPARLEHNVDEIGDESGWNVKGEDRYWKRSQHPEVFRIGKIPVVWFDRDSVRAGSPLEATITEAIDAGDMTKVYETSEATLKADVTIGEAAGGAVADGGTPFTRENFEFEPRDSPIFKDVLLDVGAGEGFAGRALSMVAYKDHQNADTDVEELVKAEERGYLAGLAGGNQPNIVKLLLICAGIILGSLAIFVLGPELFASSTGGGGGGGGGISPFLLGAWGLI